MVKQTQAFEMSDWYFCFSTFISTVHGSPNLQIVGNKLLGIICIFS